MIAIDYEKETCKFSCYYDNQGYNEYEEFTETIDFFKQLYLCFDPVLKKWILKNIDIQEFLGWCEKYNKKYLFTQDAEVQYKACLNDWNQREIDTYRDCILDESILKENKELFDFQKYGINWGLKRSSFYLADDAGLGKTLEAICIFSIWFKQNKIDAVFILVRNGMSYQWKREILKFVNVFIEDDIFIVSNDNKKDIFKQIENQKIIICPNHLHSEVFSFYKKNKKKKQKLSGFHWNKIYCDIKKLWKKENICLVIDEAHEFKNVSSVRYKASSSHKNLFSHRILMSATPAINYFEDWWAGLYMVDKSILKMPYNTFLLHISKFIGNEYGKYNIVSYAVDKINNIKNLLPTYVLKRLKKDIPEMKTKQIIKEIYLEMPELQRKLYIEFMRNEILKIEDEYDSITLKIIFKKFPYFLQIVDNPLLLEGKVVSDVFNKYYSSWSVYKDVRLDYLKSALHEYIGNQNEKVIIFDNHPKTLDILYNIFIDYNPLVSHGQTNDTDISRQEKQDLFNDKNSKYKLFLFSTAVGGAGFNLNQACKRIIFWSLPYDATLYRQAIDRIYRINNEHDAIIEIMLLDHSIDLTRYHLVTKRVELNDNILKQELTKERLGQLLDGNENLI